MKFSETSLHLTTANAASVVSVIGAASAVGRLSVGYFADHLKGRRSWALIAAVAINGISIMVIPATVGFGTVAVVCAVFGLSMGSLVTLLPIVTGDVATQLDMAKVCPSDENRFHVRCTGIFCLVN